MVWCVYREELSCLCLYYGLVLYSDLWIDFKNYLNMFWGF